MAHKKFWAMLAAGAVCGVLIVAGGVKLTSTTTFCLSCHEMRVYQKELAMSAHARDAQGNEIGCSRCHIPNAHVVRMLGAKAWMGIKDIWLHSTGDVTDLDRGAMQAVARRFTDDSNCRSCHQDLMRNAANTGENSVYGKLSHANYLGENGKSPAGCVYCHLNVAHLPEFDMRIPKNRKFAMKLRGE